MKWEEFIKTEMEKKYFQEILDFVHEQEKIYLLSPEEEYRYNSFLNIDIETIHTVIISDAPFSYTYASDGLAFSSRSEEYSYEMGRFKRLFEELNIKVENDKSIWTKNGFMMLPRELTVINGKRRNEDIWTPFTSNLVKFLINDKTKKRAFLFFDKKMYNNVRMDLIKNRGEIFSEKINFKDIRQNYYNSFIDNYTKFLKRNGYKIKLPKRE